VPPRTAPPPRTRPGRHVVAAGSPHRHVEDRLTRVGRSVGRLVDDLDVPGAVEVALEQGGEAAAYLLDVLALHRD
jgi:hypothetical protein